MPTETCPKCHNIAPRIVRFTTAAGSHAECPRCLYPPYREGGTWHQSMPIKDQHWYEARSMI